MSKPTIDEIVIEVNVRRKFKKPDTMSPDGMTVTPGREIECGNGDMMFSPIGETLRSKFIMQREGGAPPPQIFKMPDLPGQRIHLDVAKRTARITDPFNDNEQTMAIYTRAMDLIRALAEERPIHRLLAMQPIPDRVMPGLSDEDIATWQFEMRRMITEAGGTTYADPVQNCERLPSMAELMRSGQVRKPIMDPSARLLKDYDTDEKCRFQEKDAIILERSMA